MALSASGLENKIKPSLKIAFEKITLKGVSQSNFRKVTDGAVVLDSDAYKQARREALSLAENIASGLAKELAKEIVNHIKTASISCTIPIGVILTPAGGAGPLTMVTISGKVK